MPIVDDLEEGFIDQDDDPETVMRRPRQGDDDESGFNLEKSSGDPRDLTEIIGE